MLARFNKLDVVGEHLAKLLIPHHRNDHHPLLIRHFSLFLISGIFVGGQFLSNLQVGQIRVLGFATNIYQNQIISLTNQQRSANGLGSLTENSLLDQAAQRKAADMFAKNYWAHFAPDGTSPWYFFGLVGYQYTWAGENLARDFQTSDGVVQGWMNSPSHRENLLNANYTEIGVAVVNGTLLGEETTLVVQFFGRPNSATAVANSNSNTPSANPKSVTDNFVLNQQNSKPATLSAGPVTKISSQYSAAFNPLSKVAGLPWAAKVELLLLLSLFSVFLIDSFVLYRRRINREGSHSFVHAILIAILIASILVTSKGKLL